MSNPKTVLSITLILSIFFLPACSRNDSPTNNDSKVIARINNYKLTVADFKEETQGKLPANLTGPDFEKAKEDLLDSIITKKILIQEAQKENFDKNRAFIKEIERYWEQALLKLLYNKKSQELLSQIKAETGEAKDINDRKVQQALNDWINGLKTRADIKKYEENLKSIRQ